MSSQPDLSFQDGVAARVERLYAEHAGLVAAICRAYLRDRIEAEDAAQQVFLSAQRALLNGSAPREPAAWLSAIARNECLGRIRARMRDPLPIDEEPPGGTADTHTVAVAREDAARLRDALAELPAQQREAILLRELRGLSYEEVAASLAVSTSAVESLIFRARRGLQLKLRETAAALSPGEWLTPARELAARLLGGGLAAPVAAKVVAVSVGTAVVAGGVAVAPNVAGFGHAPVFKAAPAAPAKRHVHHAARHVPAAAPVVLAPVSVPKPQPVVRRIARRHEVERETTTTEAPQVAAPVESGDSGEHESDRPTTAPVVLPPPPATQEHESDDGGGSHDGGGSDD
ncbi:MAG: sigma-70 family RNA polymerase sigma factor [Actinobacteria bacterium]|nr:sigma-70 family RNA polymerase sigma factor [Actinomycetota bacterium]